MAAMLRLLCLFFSAGLAVAADEAVVMVLDPTWDDVASYVRNIPLLENYKIVEVFIRLGKIYSFEGGHITPYRTFTYNSDTADPNKGAVEICPQLQAMDVPIAAIIPTSDPACHLADLLAACVGVRGNPSTGPLAEARRDKWVMGETVRKAGLRSVKQHIVDSWSAANEYLGSLEPPLSGRNPVIFKVLEGAGGEGVVKVYSLQEAKTVFAKVSGSSSQFGGVYTKILIQEYLVGKEYAVDSVSRDGVHKVVAVWLEDFRPANGIFDQYFGFKLLDPEEEFTKVLIEYGTKVLNAVGMNNGAANTEIKFLEEENAPCLVEINARWSGINWHDGLAVENAAVGLNQYTATFQAFLEPDTFANMPAVRPLLQWGAIVSTINYQSGILKGVPGMAVAKKLKSYLDSDIVPGVTVGKFLVKTTPNSIPANIGLAHKSKQVVWEDYALLQDLEKHDHFFDIASLASVTSLASGNGSSHSLLVLFTLAMLVGAGMTVLGLTLVTRLRATDESQYVAIE